MTEGKKKGIVYLACGYEYLLMAAHSALTARDSNPGIICELITNVRFDADRTGDLSPFDKVTFVDLDTEKNRLIKTNIIDYTDLDYAVYIDGDTEVRGCLDPVFECLERFDLALKLCPKPTAKEYEVAPGIPSHLFPEWNGGVLFFRNNERSREFFKRWSEIFRREGKNRDQPALARALYESDGGARLLSLNAVWNTFRSDLPALPNGRGDSRIWHYRKAEKYPAVAPSILRLHEAFKTTVAVNNPSMTGDLEEIARRYQFLGSRFYRFSCWHPRLRGYFTRSIRLMMTLGVVPRFNLERQAPMASVTARSRAKQYEENF
jgi:hypothetical protein